MEQVSQRARITRMTLSKVEKGDPSVSMGTYAQVLFVLNLEADLVHIAEDDVLGRKLQDAGLVVKKRASKKRVSKKHSPKKKPKKDE